MLNLYIYESLLLYNIIYYFIFSITVYSILHTYQCIFHCLNKKRYSEKFKDKYVIKFSLDRKKEKKEKKKDKNKYRFYFLFQINDWFSMSFHLLDKINPSVMYTRFR